MNPIPITTGAIKALIKLIDKYNNEFFMIALGMILGMSISMITITLLGEYLLRQ